MIVRIDNGTFVSDENLISLRNIITFNRDEQSNKRKWLKNAPTQLGRWPTQRKKKAEIKRKQKPKEKNNKNETKSKYWFCFRCGKMYLWRTRLCRVPCVRSDTLHFIFDLVIICGRVYFVALLVISFNAWLKIRLHTETKTDLKRF